MTLIQILITHFKELTFSTNTISIENGKYKHELKLTYTPILEKFKNYNLLSIKSIDENYYIYDDLFEYFEKQLLIQLMFGKETGGNCFTADGEVLITFADIKSKLKPSNLFC